MQRFLTSAAIVLVALFVGTACGGPPSMADAKACLKDLDLTVSEPNDAKDPDVEEFVIGTTDQSKGKAEFLMAVAATTKNDDAVKKFQSDTADFAKQDLGTGDTKISVDSGHDGRYVWAVTGVEGSDEFAAAVACVQP